MEKKPNISESDLVSLLKELPLKDAPEDVGERIMRRITARQPGPIRRFWNRFNTTIIVPVRPSYAFCLLFLVIGSFLLGRGSIQLPPERPDSLPSAATFQPETAQAAYLIGRGLIAAEQIDKGVALLRKAAALEPENPEYAYWEGVGYWLNGNRQQERKSYIRGLSADPKSVPLLINLGHNYLSENKFQQALETYQQVLELSPEEPVAWYNSGLIYRELHQVNRERTAWKDYLELNRTGKWAFRAVERLNEYGDFSYRPYLIGARKLIISPEKLFNDASTAEQRRKELVSLTNILVGNPGLKLNVIVFLKNDRALARKRALDIKKTITEIGGSEIAERIALSWFDTPEVIRTSDSVEIVQDESLLLFSSFLVNQNKEVAI
ncbi:MAG: tetratricopeptide repeat protein [Desulfofustis sp.]|nr:tetratricopeptide repeat protein [Desulfofustis sp.]